MVLTKKRVAYTAIGISQGYWENIWEGFNKYQMTDIGTKEKIDIVHYLFPPLKH